MNLPEAEAIEIELPDFRRGMVDDYESIPYQIIPALPLQKRFSITAEAETGYSPEEAITQARRCLQCQLNIMIDPSICISVQWLRGHLPLRLHQHAGPDPRGQGRPAA